MEGVGEVTETGDKVWSEGWVGGGVVGWAGVYRELEGGVYALERGVGFVELFCCYCK